MNIANLSLEIGGNKRDFILDEVIPFNKSTNNPDEQKKKRQTRGRYEKEYKNFKTFSAIKQYTLENNYNKITW